MCLRCGDLYIGETGRMLADHFREHLADIHNAKVGKEVASHFNQTGHTIDDVAVSGISYQPMISQRCIKEARLIRNIGTLVPLGMNREDDSNYKNTYSGRNASPNNATLILYSFSFSIRVASLFFMQIYIFPSKNVFLSKRTSFPVMPSWLPLDTTSFGKQCYLECSM